MATSNDPESPISSTDASVAIPPRPTDAGRLAHPARAALGVAAAVAFGALLRATAGPSSEEADAALTGALRETPALAAALIFVAGPALCEEAIFRGPLLRRAAARWSAPVASGLSSLVFAACHPLHPLEAGLFGLALCALALATGRLREVVLAHGVHNAIGLWVVGGAAAAGACLAAAAIGLVGLGVLVFARRPNRGFSAPHV